MNHRSIVIASAMLGTVLLGGCGKKPGGQVVAVVNGEEISQQELNGELQLQQIPQGADKKAITAQVLQRLIDRKLLVQKAKAEGIDKTVDYLNQLRRGQDELIVSLLSAKTAKNVAVPDTKAVDAYIAANPSLFSGRKRYTFDQVIFPPPKDQEVLKKMAPAHSLDAVEAVLTQAGIASRRGSAVVDSGALNPEISKRIDSLPAGEPFILPANGMLIANVIKSSEAIPTDPAQARAAAVELLRRKSVDDLMKNDLDAVKKTAKIAYQPGFAPPPSAPATAGQTGQTKTP